MWWKHAHTLAPSVLVFVAAKPASTNHSQGWNKIFTDKTELFRWFSILSSKSTLRKRAVWLLPSQSNAFLIFICEVPFPFAQELRKRSCHLKDIEETVFKDHSRWRWIFFLHSFSVYLERNFLCIQLLRKNSHGCSFQEFVNINSNTLFVSKATRSLSEMQVYKKHLAFYSESVVFKSQFFWSFGSISFSPCELTDHILKWPITITFPRGNGTACSGFVLCF